MFIKYIIICYSIWLLVKDVAEVSVVVVAGSGDDLAQRWPKSKILCELIFKASI